MTEKTIAVLPFVNMSSSMENEYFSDGITEEIINALAKIQHLKVTSRTSSFYFKNKNLPIAQIGKELNVSTIIEGSVRLSGDKMRITAQLIEAKEDFHYWSESWDRKLADIFTTQNEISVIIADKLREHFGHFEIQESLVDKQTDSIQAYELSLKAKYHLNKWNPEDVQLAISLYQRALELDPQHSESYAGLADSYSFLATTGFIPFEEGWGKCREMTNRALQLNESLSEVHYQLSNMAFFLACDFNQSLQEMKKAIQINPNNAEAQQFMSFLYIISGDVKKSREHLEIAIGINPLSEETRFFKAYFHYMIEDFGQSLVLLDKCLEANDKNIPSHTVKPTCLLMMGRYDEVIHYFENIPQEIIISGDKTGIIGLAYAMKKDRVKAVEYLQLLNEQAREPNGFTADSFLYLMHAVMGDADKALAWVDNAIRNKSSLLLLRFGDPLANPIKNDPRYLEVKKSIYKTDIEMATATKKKALLDEDQVTLLRDKLLQHIAENKPFLEANLSLRSLASQLSMHPNQLSWLLNESIGKNFNEFVNHYRIETFKALSKDPKNSNLTILGLAYDSGFNSKTVFNTYFKKETGLTPKQFLKL